MVALAVSTSTAQKINVAAHKAKLEKSNADIANPKKAAKSATWYNRGKICVDALVEPTKSLFAGLDSIRDCIAFPKNNSGRDVMIDAPAPLEQAQLDELNILVDIKEK